MRSDLMGIDAGVVVGSLALSEPPTALPRPVGVWPGPREFVPDEAVAWCSPSCLGGVEKVPP